MGFHKNVEKTQNNDNLQEKRRKNAQECQFTGKNPVKMNIFTQIIVKTLKILQNFKKKKRWFLDVFLKKT